MKYLVTESNFKKRCFFVILNGRKQGFYLSNRLAKIFLPSISKQTIVEFQITNKRKKYLGQYMYQISHFEYIAQANPKVVIYDLHQLRKQMSEVVSKFEYFLFLDCEMTMPSYQEEEFIPEIVQSGYVLTNRLGEVLVADGDYIKPKRQPRLNRRTRRFLNLDEQLFWESAISYNQLYQNISSIIETYQPKIVVWGKNDIIALNHSYEIHKKTPLTTEKSFIDLLKLHKDFYNLKDDLGLFKAYQSYYGKLDDKQIHDAKMDAILTKDIFDAFLLNIKR